MTFEEWLEFGIKNGYCSDQFCDTHDGPPMHESEEKAWEDGGDPCMHMLRLGTIEDWNISTEEE